MKLPKLNQSGVAHYILPLLLVVAVAGIGTYTLTRSHAAPAPTYRKIGGTTYYGSGAKMPGALVSLHNNTTGASSSTTSDSNANYLFNNGVVGNSYTIKATKSISCTNYYSDPYTATATQGPSPSIIWALTLSHSVRGC